MAKLATPSITPPSRPTSELESLPESDADISVRPPDNVSSNEVVEFVNMDRSLLRFADPETLHPKRSYTALSRLGLINSEPAHTTPQMVSEGVDLLKEVLDIVTEIGAWLVNISDEVRINGRRVLNTAPINVVADGTLKSPDQQRTSETLLTILPIASVGDRVWVRITHYHNSVASDQRTLAIAFE
jgi:hypothetical protein